MKRRATAVGVATLVVVALVSILVGWQRGEATPTPASAPRRAGAWSRIDLWATPPDNAHRRPVRPRELAFGHTGRRALERRPERVATAPVPESSAARGRALEQVAGRAARWRLTLGSEPFLTFVPLQSPERPCDCRLRAEVVSGDGAHTIADVAAEPGYPVAPATVEADLRRWAGSTVEIVLSVVPSAGTPPRPPTRALWGSPAIVERRESPDQPVATVERPNVLLLGFDTLRADALGAWGRTPSVTPTLDRLAAESDVFLDAISSFNVTTPSFVSLMTGLYGKHHDVHALHVPLPASRTTLAELLAGAGWDTFATVSANHLGDRGSGLAQGFGTFLESQDQDAAELAVDRTLAWLDAPRERPFFAWVHLYDPHTPHTPPRPFAEGRRPAAAFGMGPVASWTAVRETGFPGWSDLRLGGDADLYAGEVAYLDRHVGRLLDWLDSRGELDRTLVVAIADHGENILEHGLTFRHAGLWEATTHVPLLVRWPGPRQPGRRLEGLVQNVDVFPTILAAVGLPVPPQDGVDLRRVVVRGGRPAAFSQHADRHGDMIRTRDWRLFRSRGNPLVPDGTYLYDLRSDPAETENLAGRALAEERRLGDLLDAWLAYRPHAGADAVAAPVDAEARRRLAALGYVQ